MMSPGPRQSRGAALIIALMVLALVGVIGASMSLDYLITVKRASNQLIGEQAYSYGIAAEAFAIKALQMDLLLDTQEKGGRHDALDEFWAQESPPFQTAEGAYGGRLYDLSGRFNINTLANQAERQGEARNRHDVLTVHEGRFYRLLRSLSNEDEDFLVTEEQALAILMAVIDWLDADDEPTGIDGAEDQFYADIEGRPPYRAANRPMVSPSELLLVAHMTPEIYKRLLPHITVWPARPNPTGTDGDGINVNTATPNVLRALKVPPAENGQSFLGEPATLQEIEPILTLQQQEGGIAREYPLGSLFAGAGGADTIVDTGLAVSSDFFLLDGHVTIGGVATHMQSVISRKNPERIQVILRTTGGL